MSDAQATPRNYASLDMVRRHLDWDDVDGDRDKDVLLIAQAVTERIEQGLGVAWRGDTDTTRTQLIPVDGFYATQPHWRLSSADNACIGEMLRLPFPILTVSAITVDGLTMEPTDFPPAGYDGRRGWYRGLIVRRSFVARQVVAVTGVWADDPGGDPPRAVELFATRATEQEWRRMAAGGSRTIYPDGTAVTLTDAWNPKGDWGQLIDDFGLPVYKARVR